MGPFAAPSLMLALVSVELLLRLDLRHEVLVEEAAAGVLQLHLHVDDVPPVDLWLC